MLELKEFVVSLPWLTQSGKDFLLGFALFWICFGLICAALKMFADLFQPNVRASDYVAGHWSHYLHLFVCVVGWPFTLFYVYKSVEIIHRDAEKRKKHHKLARLAESYGGEVLMGSDYIPYVHFDMSGFYADEKARENVQTFNDLASEVMREK